MSFDFYIFKRMDTNIFADSSAINTPIGIPVWPVACSLFTFSTTLFPTASELLSIGDFTAHDLMPSLPRRLLFA